MDNLLLYLLKVAAGISLLYLSYLLFFSKDTFYMRNRFLLILTLILPVILPAIKVPVVIQSTVPAETVNAFDNIIFSASSVAKAGPGTQNSFDINSLFLWIYFSIAGLVLLRGVISIISTFRIIRKGSVQAGKFPKVIISEIQLPPFSFYPYAVIPAEEYNKENCRDILDHEFAHLRQGHTFDLLLGELFTAFQWFNPFVWLIKRSIILNHEYLADRVSLSNKSVKEYQYRLLNFKIGLKNISLAHNFNSLIKNRIIMINKKPTRKYAMMKNLVILPIVAIVAYAFVTPTYRYNSSESYILKNNVTTNLVDGKVKGIILDQDGSPLPGTNIQISGTTIGTSADLKGQFTLGDVPEKASLIFSFVGYKQVKLIPEFSKEMTVRMVRATFAVESVVVTPGKKAEPINSDIARTPVITEAPNVSKKKNVFIITEEMPTFQGGYSSLEKWISDHINYPDQAVRYKISGEVFISFVVKSTGKIGSVKVVKSLDPILDNEAKRVIGGMPDWKPGKQNEKPVDVDFVIPVAFTLSTPGSVLPQTSMANFYRFLNMNISYPQEAKNASDTGSIFVVVKLTKGGTIKDCKAFTDRKEIKVPVLEEVVIVGYKPTGETKAPAISKTGSNEHLALKNECLKVANMLGVTEIPEWKEKDMEFVIPFKFILK